MIHDEEILKVIYTYDVLNPDINRLTYNNSDVIMIPEYLLTALREKHVSDAEAYVLFELMRQPKLFTLHEESFQKGATFSQSRRTIAKALNMTESTVNKAIRGLVAKHIIVCIKRGCRDSAAVYQLALDS